MLEGGGLSILGASGLYGDGLSIVGGDGPSLTDGLSILATGSQF